MQCYAAGYCQDHLTWYKVDLIIPDYFWKLYFSCVWNLALSACVCVSPTSWGAQLPACLGDLSATVQFRFYKTPDCKCQSHKYFSIIFFQFQVKTDRMPLISRGLSAGPSPRTKFGESTCSSSCSALGCRDRKWRGLRPPHPGGTWSMWQRRLPLQWISVGLILFS